MTKSDRLWNTNINRGEPNRLAKVCSSVADPDPPDPDPLVRGMDPDPDPDPSIIKQ